MELNKDSTVTEPKYTGKGTDFYLASDDVAEVVNLAVDLDRPILVEGEPGCGKTMLAYSIAAEKQLPAVIKISVRSTSQPNELLYNVNSLRRLQDAQDSNNVDARFIFPYLNLGPLGQAIQQQQRCVVLIDEIDKADIDFPNDLLDVLDGFSFDIDALPPEEEDACRQRHGFGRTIASETNAHPIVVITSNREKRLPEPFLRRCLYVRLPFPDDPGELRDIVEKNNQGSVQEMDEAILSAAVESFRGIRQLSIGNTRKPPSTSELIDWVKILFWKGENVESISQDKYLPPYWKMLFKTMNDLDVYENLARGRQEHD